MFFFMFMINKFVPIYKILPVNPATITAEKGPFWQLEEKMVPFNSG